MNKVNDENWEKFTNLFKVSWLSFHDKDKLLSLVDGDEKLAMVIAQVSSRPEEWLTKKIPALQNKTPLWCLAHARKSELKTILMSMPR